MASLYQILRQEPDKSGIRAQLDNGYDDQEHGCGSEEGTSRSHVQGPRDNNHHEDSDRAGDGGADEVQRPAAGQPRQGLLVPAPALGRLVERRVAVDGGHGRQLGFSPNSCASWSSYGSK